MLHQRRLRQVSWALAATAVVVPAALAVYQTLAFNEWAQARDGRVCGLPLLGIWFGAVVLFAVSLLVASILNGIGLSHSRPVPVWRWVEFGAMLVPVLSVAALVAYVLVYG